MKSLLGFTDKLSGIDISIAIYHIASETDGFNFSNESIVPECKGYLYVGTISHTKGSIA